MERGGRAVVLVALVDVAWPLINVAWPSSTWHGPRRRCMAFVDVAWPSCPRCRCGGVVLADVACRGRRGRSLLTWRGPCGPPRHRSLDVAWRGRPRSRRGILIVVVALSSSLTWPLSRWVVDAGLSTWRGRGVVVVDGGGGDRGMVVVVAKGAAWLIWVNLPDLASPGPCHQTKYYLIIPILIIKIHIN